MAQIPEEVASVVPSDARLVKKTTTKQGTKYVFQHVVGKFVIDGNRLVIQVKHGTREPEIIERIWTEDLAPPEVNDAAAPAPEEKPEGKGIPVLIDPDDPFYIWEPDKKPAPKTPCLLVQNKAHVKVLDMKGNLLGRGVPPP